MVIAISVLLLIACLIPGVGKLTSQPKMQASAAHFGIPWARYRLIGIAEVAAAAGIVAGLVARSIGVAAAAGMVVLLVGALVAHRRAGDPAKEATPAFAALGLSCVYLVVALTR